MGLRAVNRGVQARRRQDPAGRTGGIEFLQPGDDIATTSLNTRWGKVVTELGQAAQELLPRHTAFGSWPRVLSDAWPWTHKGIGRIFPFGDNSQGSNLQAGRFVGRSLRLWTANILPIEQHLGLQFLGEQALVADLRQSESRILVALGRHRLDADLQVGVKPWPVHRARQWGSAQSPRLRRVAMRKMWAQAIQVQSRTGHRAAQHPRKA